MDSKHRVVPQEIIQEAKQYAKVGVGSVHNFSLIYDQRTRIWHAGKIGDQQITQKHCQILQMFT